MQQLSLKNMTHFGSLDTTKYFCSRTSKYLYGNVTVVHIYHDYYYNGMACCTAARLLHVMTELACLS